VPSFCFWAVVVTFSQPYFPIIVCGNAIVNLLLRVQSPAIADIQGLGNGYTLFI
jgi:hypothetical protein